MNDDVAPGIIRNLVVGVLVRDGHVLVEEYPGSPTQHAFHRGIGGGLEFGERAADAIVREYREELDVDIEVARLLAVTENFFEWAGRPAHEIVHIFEVASPQLASLPVDASLPILDQITRAVWRPLAGHRLPLYPDGLPGIVGNLT